MLDQLLREKYQTVTSLSGEGVWRFDIETPISISLPEDEQIRMIIEGCYLAECNFTMARMYGLADPSKLVGRRFPEFQDPGKAETIEFLREFIRSGYRIVDLESIESDINGNPLYILNSFCGIVENGKMLRAWGTQRNITSQRTAERELKEERERLRLTLDAAKIGTWEYDPTTGHRLWDELCYRLMGATPGTPVDDNAFINAVRIDYREEVAAALELSMRDAAEHDFDVECPVIGIEDGVERWLKCSGQLKHEALTGRKRFVGIIFDISSRKHSEDEARRARQAAEEASRAKSDFLANMSHEMRTPLAAILGFAELALETSDPESEVSESLHAIDRNGRHLLQLIEEILDIAKVESGRVQLDQQRLSLSEFVDGLGQEAALRAREKGIRFRVELERGFPASVVTDPLRLKQILVNLLGNATKFTERGEVVFKAGFADGPRPMLVFEVMDTGFGIPDEQAGCLFKPFSQIDSSLKRKFGGTGLGLALSRRLARLMGGDVVLKSSEPGVGSVFVATVEIRDPELQPSAEQTAQPDSVVHASTRRLDGVRVLTVEDSIDNQILISRYLKPVGAAVDLADNGAEGVKKALESDYDVVLMDIQMPEMDGYEAIRQLRAHGFEKPVLALTAHAMKGERQKVEQAGFDDFLTKPIARSALVDVIGRHLHREASRPRQ